MGYWNRPTSISSPQADSSRKAIAIRDLGGNAGGSSDEFYEIEPGLVLDIILDKDHPFLKTQPFTLNPTQTATDVDGKRALKTDPDLSWVGRVLVRLLYSQRDVEKEDLVWAIPLESNLSEYPLLNEVVGVVSYLGQYYYTRKVNAANIPNANPDFNLELINGGFRPNPQSTIQGNRELRVNKSDTNYTPFQGPLSKINSTGGIGYEGALGRYFYFNSRIRTIKRHEGDLTIESRFGQSIRFGAYDDNRSNDSGKNADFNGYTDYKGNGVINPSSKKEAGGGNPMIIIRNRQRPLTSAGKHIKVYENIPPVIGTAEEKNIGGYIAEDVNNDGTSIHITSGVTISGFVANCSKKMWGNGSEEQTGFNGTTNFKYPKLSGDQIVINSDRVIISAKKGEMFHFAKNRYSIVTDDEYTVDAQDQIVLTTNNKTVLNSPAIYLGEYDQTGEPVLLGQTTVNWLYDLCNLLLGHTHWYKHTHPDAGSAQPNVTQTIVQNTALSRLRDRLHKLMSKRVFVVGGGFAPGKNGGTIKGGTTPVNINIASGAGVPGGFSGSSKKLSAAEDTGKQSSVAAAHSVKATDASFKQVSQKAAGSHDAVVKQDLADAKVVDKQAKDAKVKADVAYKTILNSEDPAEIDKAKNDAAQAANDASDAQKKMAAISAKTTLDVAEAKRKAAEAVAAQHNNITHTRR